MNPSALFINRPVTTTLVMLGILLFGIMAYNRLPVSDLPSVDFPTIQVSASLAGASPETMAAAVATPLEKEFATIAGIDSMTSTNGLGSTRITLQFDLDRDIDAAAQDVQAAITAATRQLPSGMTTPPTYRKVNPADFPILYLSISSPTLRLSDLSEYAETLMAQRISMVNGVAQVMVYGSRKYAVRVQLDPELLAARGIGVDEVSAAITRGNVNLPVGTVAGQEREYTVHSSGKLMTADAYRPLIVAWKNGAPVRLDEVAKVFDSVEQPRRANWYNFTPAMILAIQRQPGTNTVGVAQAVKDLLPTFRSQLPAAVHLDILFDRSDSIKESVGEVKFTLMLTIALVIMVIFLFLRNFTATLIPSLALPLSVIGTFAVMYQLGFSLNNISLMALTLSVGFVVDDAIVMLENIVRHMEQGKSPFQAAMDGSREIFFTIVSMTISLAAVFLPVLFMGGVVGRLFHEFAVTICSAILFSGLVSLTLTPMLCKLLLRSGHGQTHGWFYQLMESFFEHMRLAYEKSLRLVLAHKFVVLLFSFVLIAVSVHLFRMVPKGFIPSEDSGSLQIMVEGEQGIAIEAMAEHQHVLMDIVSKDPAVDAFMSVIGAGGPNAAGNSGRIMVRLKPRAERTEHANEVMQRLRGALAPVPGVRVFLQNPPPIRLGGMATKGQYQLTLQSPNIEELYREGAALEQRLRDLPMLQDVNSDLEVKNPQLNITIDRDKASALGITAYQIEDALATAYGNREISTIYAAHNVYKVMIELKPDYQTRPDALALLYVRAPGDKLISLDSLASWSIGAGPLSINHSGQLPAVTLSFNLQPGVSLGDAVSAVEDLALQTLPDTISTAFQGEAQAFQSSFQGLWLLLLMAIVVIYIVLGILYESFVHPLTILSGLPSAGVGALLTLSVFGQDLNIYGFVGIIMLIGIVKKNAIMMIDFALEAQRTEHLAPGQAIFEGALVRFRPIMMTTMAALMGTLPIALGMGAGAEARRPLGLAVVGGLLVSQLLTLYFTPVYYMYMDKIQHWARRIFQRQQQ
ncbi:MAG: efflux RND transporter permease subunit [Desulfovibrionales bacterium]|nr:efflux RND transporter permease subunit [Desulfovibrionales bacterium]